MKAEFDVKMTRKDLFLFLLNNTYRKMTGIIWCVFSAAVIAVAVYTWGKIDIMQSVLLIVLACLYTVINPFILYVKAVRQMKQNEFFQKPLHYEIDERGIKVSQGETSETTEWNRMWKAVRYGSQVLIYVSNIRVFTLPCRAIGDQYPTLVKLANAGLEGRSRLKER